MTQGPRHLYHVDPPRPQFSVAVAMQTFIPSFYRMRGMVVRSQASSSSEVVPPMCQRGARDRRPKMESALSECLLILGDETITRSVHLSY